MTNWGPANTAHKNLNLPDEQLRRYCVWDCFATARIIQPLTDELVANHQWEFWRSNVVPLIPAVVAMQQRGLLVDREARNKYRAQLRDELAEVEAAICDADPTHTLTPPDLNSYRKKGAFLFKTLGLPEVKTTATGHASVDQDVLDKLLKKVGKVQKWAGVVPVLLNLFHRSRLNTIYSRYLTFEIDEDGRVRARCRMYGAETGRFSYTEPPLHQYPEEARHIFVAAPGCVFVAADYNQVEARIFSWFTSDHPTLADLREGRDIHTTMAQEIFGITQEAWGTLSTEARKHARDAAKTFRYGIAQYGGDASTYHAKLFCPCPRCVGKAPSTLDLTRAQLKECQDRWFARHPNVLTYREALVKRVTGPGGTRCTTNPFGRKRFYSAPWPKVERELYNADTQSTAFDLIARAQVRLHALGAPIVLQHHDSLVVECAEGEAEGWAKKLREEMERAVPELGGMVFPVEIKVGTNWGNLEKV